MAIYDVFNGDADGICALLQLRNAQPADSQLITGVKRDIKLLDRVQVSAGDELNVFDISFDKNRHGVEAALAAGASVFYVDHHFAGDIPKHPKLTTHINLSADVCTSLLINGQLKGQFAEWALVGAFGDNLKNSAKSLAKTLKLSEQQLIALEHLGIYINYNGYGSSVEDLHFAPDQLYRCMSRYSNPLDFMDDDKNTFQHLEQGYQEDMDAAAHIEPEFSNDNVAVFLFPDQPWARRVSGVYGNDLANQFPQRGHAVVTAKPNGNYLVSVRAPLSNKTGADELCRSFASGGGRAAAAGINDLPVAQLGDFIDRFNQFYSAK
ncbi:DHH family phosphoesterase [Dasania sp. GY-MA-18]|uniref:DHH family phosphoesterase n=1 Tax=Dasania phycosphaerae TaxID=2950436 RepID=A0A9J6RII5_9GAMM|nr:MULTISPECIES: DHH family phosphoesterase [Dasania]MCR8921636.1 DHH family phosphoesterase [Dasania sp. GY-MA-18]MCZ0864064.1 DHH family phosphoesterase [Dasania phycosphaerae]MCZ0867792.1 DHH family phosphoesterase [Dasania phycosphaerae]